MSVTLGVNHMFLYPASVTDEAAHTQSLAELVNTPLVDALDVWVWRTPSRAAEEIAILRASGKTINYNIGDRAGEQRFAPASRDKAERDFAYGMMMREIGFALKAGAKKIVFASGPDDPADREGAKERLFGFVMRVLAELPQDVTLCLEPTDRDIDKRFLFGPLDETAAFIEDVRRAGFANIGLLLDMCHVPLMHETLKSAVAKSAGTLRHVHLGNAVVKDPKSPFYGDKHVPWSYPGSEYTETDGVQFLRLIEKTGYFARPDATVSFEMRPYNGLSAEETLAKFVAVWRTAVGETA